MSMRHDETMRLASEANAAANAYREAVDQPLGGLVGQTNRALDAANALLKAVDALTTFLCDEEC